MTTATTTRAATTAPASRSAGGSRRPARRHRRWGVGANIIAVVFCVVWIFPVYWMVNTAFKPRPEVMTPTPIFYPRDITLHNFVDAMFGTTVNFFTSLRNSIIVVLAALVFGMLIALFASAALSRFRFRGRRAILMAILAVQMLPVGALLIPQFLIFNNLGLIGNYLGLILAYIAMVLPFGIWALRGFFVTIPVEVEEAAMMDGAGTWTILWRVLFPLVAPGVIAVSIFGFISTWNDYITAYTFMKSQTMYTLPVWLVSFSTPTTGTDFGGQMAGSVLFSLPVVVFFLIVQRHLVAGMAAGAVKG